jgi:5-(carboxyamino)imidazole ribonucleotide mutase
MAKNPKILIIMGSQSDLPIMEKAGEILNQFKISYEVVISSAHRNPEKVVKLAKNANKKFEIIIAGAGMAAHLPGVIASHTTLPIIGVPIHSKALKGFDALYSIVQMPKGIPVATVAINGSANAALLAIEILALKYKKIQTALKNYRKKLSHS